jgi:hypothetical protein
VGLVEGSADYDSAPTQEECHEYRAGLEAFQIAVSFRGIDFFLLLFLTRAIPWIRFFGLVLVLVFGTGFGFGFENGFGFGFGIGFGFWNWFWNWFWNRFWFWFLELVLE